MVEPEPALLNLRRQLRQTLVDGGPRAEVLQSCRTTLLQGLLQMEPAFVVHVVVKIDVHARSWVVQQKPARLRNGKLVGRGVHEQRSDTQRGLQKALHGIVAQACLLHNLCTCQSVLRVENHLQDTELHHQARSLEHHGAPGDKFRQPLGLTRRQLVFSVCFL